MARRAVAGGGVGGAAADARLRWAHCHYRGGFACPDAVLKGVPEKPRAGHLRLQVSVRAYLRSHSRSDSHHVMVGALLILWVPCAE